MSLPEVLLWQRLRNSPQGLRFRKQHPIDPYVTDFYCAAARLVIEIDGEGHNRADQPERDSVRDRFIQTNGYHVLRTAAADVLKNPDEVAASIVAHAASPLHHASGAVPLPASGEE